jgi:imidazolonepropionase-like amidohydrolase
MERAGLSALAVINAATGAGSKRLAFKEKFGQIRPGFRSRFILMQHSPLETVANLQKEKIVVYDGKIYESDRSLPTAGL